MTFRYHSRSKGQAFGFNIRVEERDGTDCWWFTPWVSGGKTEAGAYYIRTTRGPGKCWGVSLCVGAAQQRMREFKHKVGLNSVHTSVLRPRGVYVGEDI